MAVVTISRSSGRIGHNLCTTVGTKERSIATVLPAASSAVSENRLPRQTLCALGFTHVGKLFLGCKVKSSVGEGSSLFSLPAIRASFCFRSYG